MMIRKIVFCLALILSVQNPTYVIGVCAIGSIMAAILVGAYGMEKWKVETRFNCIMEILQAMLMIMFAILQLLEMVVILLLGCMCLGLLFLLLLSFVYLILFSQ